MDVEDVAEIIEDTVVEVVEAPVKIINKISNDFWDWIEGN